MKKHTITNKTILESYDAIPKLDGFQIKGSALLHLTKIGLKLDEHAQPIIKTRNEIAKRYFPDGKAKPDDPKLKEYTEEVLTILDETTTLELPTLTYEDLNLEENAIPVSILMTLEWLLDSK